MTSNTQTIGAPPTRIPAKLGSRGLLILAVLALAGILFGAAIWRSEERALKRRLARLAALVEKTSAETSLQTLNRMRRIGDHFAAEVEFVPGSALPTTLGRQELLLFIQNARASLAELHVRVREQKVTPAADRKTATTHAVVQVEVKGPTDQATEVREAIIEWTRAESGAWQIRSVRSAETIRNPTLLNATD